MESRRLVVTLVLVGVGSALAAAGPEDLVSAIEAVAGQAEFVLLILAGVALFLALASPRLLAGPVALAAAGLFVFGLRRGFVSGDHLWRAVGGVVLVLGVWLAASGSSWHRGGPMRRVMACFFPRSIRFPPDEPAPHYLSLLVVGTRATVDFTHAEAAKRGIVEVVVSCWLGRVELVVPDGWPVAAGRVTAAYGTSFVGQLDAASSVADVIEEAAMLNELVNARRQRLSLQAAPRSCALVVHVLGAGGEIVLSGRK